MYELTIFKNQFDNKTHKRVSMKTWDEFVDLLYGLSKQKGEKGGNNSYPLISPAVFEDGSTCSNKSTDRWVVGVAWMSMIIISLVILKL